MSDKTPDFKKLVNDNLNLSKPDQWAEYVEGWCSEMLAKESLPDEVRTLIVGNIRYFANTSREVIVRDARKGYAKPDRFAEVLTELDETKVLLQAAGDKVIRLTTRIADLERQLDETKAMTAIIIRERDAARKDVAELVTAVEAIKQVEDHWGQGKAGAEVQDAIRIAAKLKDQP